jgi:hypothetical protein
MSLVFALPAIGAFASTAIPVLVFVSTFNSILLKHLYIPAKCRKQLGGGYYQ